MIRRLTTAIVAPAIVVRFLVDFGKFIRQIIRGILVYNDDVRKKLFGDFTVLMENN